MWEPLVPSFCQIPAVSPNNPHRFKPSYNIQQSHLVPCMIPQALSLHCTHFLGCFLSMNFCLTGSWCFHKSQESPGPVCLRVHQLSLCTLWGNNKCICGHRIVMCQWGRWSFEVIVAWSSDQPQYNNYWINCKRQSWAEERG